MSVPEPDHAPAQLEAAGWRALSTDADAAHAFYAELLEPDVTLLLPGGTVVSGRRAVLESMSGPPWSTHELHDVTELRPSPDVGVVHYRATARRDGDDEYAALVASTYVRRDGGWRLVLHQHTPL